jgi:hypothetical protein
MICSCVLSRAGPPGAKNFRFFHFFKFKGEEGRKKERRKKEGGKREREREKGEGKREEGGERGRSLFLEC